MKGTGATGKPEFEAFVRAATDPLFRSGLLMTNDVAETEDLLQETFLRVARHWRRVRSMEYPLAYARRILVNLVLDGARNRRRHEAAGTLEDAPPVADQSSLRMISGIDDRSEFRWALATLPARQRAVLILRYWDDLPEHEVAEILRCPVGTVKSNASRGVTELRRILGQPAPVVPARPSASDEETRSC